MVLRTKAILKILFACTAVFSAFTITFPQINVQDLVSKHPSEGVGNGSVGGSHYEQVLPSETAPAPIAVADQDEDTKQGAPPPPALDTSPISNPSVPQIEIIAIWDTRDGRDVSYIQLFFHSVAMNPQVKLLLVEVHKDLGCKTRELSDNVKHLCLSLEEYVDLHVDYFCERWRCSTNDRTIVHDFLKEQTHSDRNHSFYRILRAVIFAKFLDPETTIWGWCDFDTYWGNFGRAFPWDVAHDFDVIAVGWQQEPPQNHLFLRGHMAFFRNHPSTHAKLAAYPLYSSLAVMRYATVRVDAEESYLSHYIFSENVQFTFLLIGGLPWWDSMVLFSDEGVWSVLEKVSWRNDESKNKAGADSDGNEVGEWDIDEKQLPLKTRQRLYQMLNPTTFQTHSPEPASPPHTLHPSNTFSSDAEDTTANIFHHGYNFEGFKWYPDEYITYVEPDWSPYEVLEKGYIMRRQPGTEVVKRLESRERFLIKDETLNVKFDEALYLHFQHEKHRSFFKQLYTQPFQGGNLHVHWGKDGGEIWDREGNIVKKSGWTRSS